MLIVGEKGRAHKQRKVSLNFEKKVRVILQYFRFYFPFSEKSINPLPVANRDVELDLSSIAETDTVILY